MVKTYRAKQILEKVGISRGTLYKWLKQRKVPDVYRDRNNFRIFTDKDIQRLLDYKNFIKKPPKPRLRKKWSHLRKI